jgi:hypothetical protein
MQDMKKLIWIGLAWVAALSGPAVTPAAAQEDAVLLVTPARYLVMQVAFDVARRYPTVLVSYQGSAQEPQLHVWNGYEWMPLSLADYQSGAFLQAYPGRTAFLGDDALLPARPALDRFAWCTPGPSQVPNLETHELVNGIGRYLPFTPADWRWFAGRYNLTLTNLQARKRPKPPATRAGTTRSAPVGEAAAGILQVFHAVAPGRPGAGGGSAAMAPVPVQAGDVVDIPAP